MHELSIAQSIIDIVAAEMSKNRLSRVEAITLRIGEMTQIMPDALVFGFECLSRQTVLEGAGLIIESVPARGYCTRCAREFEVKDWHFSCPLCGQGTVDIVSGRELDVVSIEGG